MTSSSFSVALRRRLLRSLPTTRLLAPTALLLALSLACGVGEGERLMTGMCPSGEVCSPAVRGLWFDGSSPEDHTLSAIALGGVERVEFHAVTPFGRDAAVDVDVDAGGPALPNFTVSSTSGVVQILASARRSDRSGEAALQGAALGTATLRVTESASGALLDRIQVRVGAVANVDLHAPECMAVPQEPASGEVVSFSNWHTLRCGAVWAGSHVRAGLNLVAADGETLWDDSLTHDGVAPTEVLGLLSSLVVDVQAPTSGMLELEMSGASGVHFARLPVVSRVADIWLNGDPSREVWLTVGVATVLCADGVFDVVDGSRGAVLGAPAVFIGDGPALALTPAGDGPDAVGSRSACRSVTLTENVPHRFTVTMGTRTRAFTVTPILPSTTALRRARGIATARVVPRSPRPLPGERMSH